MPMPSDVPVIDLMMGIPDENFHRFYGFLRPMLRDAESRDRMKMPAGYMFKDIPETGSHEDYVAYTVEQMDRYNIERALIGVDERYQISLLALEKYPDRFMGSYDVDPNRGMEAVRTLRRMVEHHGVVAATAFPAGCNPQVPIDDRKFFPIYAACVDLDIPICVTTGVPGPRVPLDCQKTERADPVCWYFPELRFVMRHGAEPWEDLAVKLMLKWPNLYYSTSAFAPKYYPRAVIDYANTRGADKVMYAGYFPMGLSLERIFRELAGVPLRDHVWPKFLRENALRVFKLGEPAG